MSFRFHFLGMPHTTTHPDWVHCAYTSKVIKALKMFSRRGHQCIDYSNEGALVPDGVEHVEIFAEAKRVAYFGPHDRQKLYAIEWDPAKPYWIEYNKRCVDALLPRVQRGDFIMTLSGNCQVAPVGDAFPGSYGGTAQHAMLVEWGIGYYGTASVYRIFESQSHREWIMGRVNHTTSDWSAEVVHNFFDLDDFPFRPATTESTAPILTAGPYFLFIGRVIEDKGVRIALETVAALRDRGFREARLVVAGQGCDAWRDLPEWVSLFGAANIQERASLMAGATAVLNPTLFREPFGGTAVEAQLSGTPAITTDHGAFCETVLPEWRCASHREFVAAAARAIGLGKTQRKAIRARAVRMFSLEAIAPQYERIFQRYMDRWGNGWYSETPVDPAEVRGR